MNGAWQGPSGTGSVQPATFVFLASAEVGVGTCAEHAGRCCSMCPRRTFNEILRLGGVIDGERPPVEAQGVPVALEPPLDDGSSRSLGFSCHHPG